MRLMNSKHRLCARASKPRLLALLAGVALVGVAPARGKDLETLSRFVTPAYTAMNFTLVCAGKDAGFISQTSGPRGNALHYAEHIKNEAIESLSYGEALIALKAAADAARHTALQTFRRLNSDDPAREAEQIKTWCETDGRTFVRNVIRDHDDRHEVLLLHLRESKRQ